MYIGALLTLRKFTLQNNTLGNSFVFFVNGPLTLHLCGLNYSSPYYVLVRTKQHIKLYSTHSLDHDKKNNIIHTREDLIL